uniref:Uncharacterized protein n=1 Tax=Physcomitrium patens TaxID=3218 RepID=A0A2K1KFZ6_PHYPA|nr:hypothetical protein PHYPA_009077 [Physcomitrium patens]
MFWSFGELARSIPGMQLVVELTPQDGSQDVIVFVYSMSRLSMSFYHSTLNFLRYDPH